MWTLRTPYICSCNDAALQHITPRIAAFGGVYEMGNHVKEGFRENHVKEGFRELLLWGVAAYALAGVVVVAVRGVLWLGHLII